MFKKESKNWIVMLDNGPIPYYHESNVIFVNIHTLLQSIEFVVVLVLVLVLRPR